MARIKPWLILLPLGLAAGAGGGAGVSLVTAPKSAKAEPLAAASGRFVTLGALLIPVMLADGQLTAYVTIEAQIEVGEADEEAATERVPLIIHAVNLRAFTTPLGAGPDGRLPDAARVRAIVAEEAGKILGSGRVRSIALTRLAPA